AVSKQLSIVMSRRVLRLPALRALLSFRAQRGISLCLRPTAGQRIGARFLAALGMTALHKASENGAIDNQQSAIENRQSLTHPPPTPNRPQSTPSSKLARSASAGRSQT